MQSCLSKGCMWVCKLWRETQIKHWSRKPQWIETRLSRQQFQVVSPVKKILHINTKLSSHLSSLAVVQSPGEQCTNNALGMEYERIHDDNITSNKDDGQNLAPYGRLGHPSGWCTLRIQPGYLQISLSTIFFICAFAIQGHFNSDNGFVKKFRLELSTSENNWDFYRNKDDSEVSNGRVSQLL